MELRQLRHFLAAADHRNFGRAAESLSITQQALSHSVAQLERHLQARLFERGQFGAELTETGRALESHARLALAEVELGRREVEALKGGMQGHVRFGVSSVVATRLLPRVVARFDRHRPRVGLSVRVEHSRELYAGLLRGELEFVALSPLGAVEDGGDVVHEPIAPGFGFDANFLLMRAGHPLLGGPAPDAAALASQAWVMPEGLPAFRRALLGYFSQRGVAPPARILNTDSVWFTKSLLLQSDYVALLGREAAAPEISAALLAGMPLPGLALELPAYLAFRARSEPQPAARELIRIFRRVAAEAA